MSYFPYGEERTATTDGREKFGTYFRDPAPTGGLDYADQRYYSPIAGRFIAPDLGNAGDLNNPQSLNLYSYVLGDPINLGDPSGLAPTCGNLGYSFNGTYMGTVSSVLGAGDDVALLAEAEYTEAAHGSGSNPQEMVAIGDVIMNRWQIVNGYYTMDSGPTSSAGSSPVTVIPGWGYPDGGLASIVMNTGQFGIFHTQTDGTVALTASAQGNLNAAINADITSTLGAKLCSDLLTAITSAEDLWSRRNAHQLYVSGNLVVTAFNSFNPPRPSDANELRVGSFGTSGNVFYGIPFANFSWNLGFAIPTFPRLPGRPPVFHPPQPTLPRPPR